MEISNVLLQITNQLGIATAEVSILLGIMFIYLCRMKLKDGDEETFAYIVAIILIVLITYFVTWVFLSSFMPILCPEYIAIKEFVSLFENVV